VASGNAPATALRFILEPGTATQRQLTEVLVEIATLGRALGLTDLKVETGDCRVAKPAPGPAGTPAQPHTFVEVRWAASGQGDSADASSQLPLWDQFRSCLGMALPGQTGLGEAFSLAEAAPARDKLRTIAAEAAAQACRSTAKPPSDQKSKGKAAEKLPIDRVTQQLKRVEGLIQRLSADHNLRMEFASPESPAASPSASAPAAVEKKPRRRWIWVIIALGLFAAAAAGGYFGRDWLLQALGQLQQVQ
jgi:hypothetical protein